MQYDIGNVRRNRNMTCRRMKKLDGTPGNIAGTLVNYGYYSRTEYEAAGTPGSMAAAVARHPEICRYNFLITSIV